MPKWAGSVLVLSEVFSVKSTFRLFIFFSLSYLLPLYQLPRLSLSDAGMCLLCRACSFVSNNTLVDIKDQPLVWILHAFITGNVTPPPSCAASQTSEVSQSRSDFRVVSLIRLYQTWSSAQTPKPTPRSNLLLTSFTSFLFFTVVALNPHRLQSLPLALMFGTLSINLPYFLSVSASPPLASRSHFPL